ncbi:hypothetical protein BH23BAC1_BH23BAC1_37270 [soil metagenome]
MLPSYKSLVDEVSEILDISNDSAYRRIRGEKSIDFDEIKKLSQHFRISLDQQLNLQSDAIIFNGKLNTYTSNNYDKWLEDVLQQLQFVNTFKNRHIYFLIKDIPPFYQFHIPELAAFKHFFWMKSILHYESFKGKKFSISENSFDEFSGTCKNIIKLYNNIPTTEIWNLECINSTLRQIEFYHEMNVFASKEDVKIIYQKLIDLVNHIEKQAEAGSKFLVGQHPQPENMPYRLFVNELILGDNTFMAEVDGHRVTFLNHSVLYFVSSRDINFNNAMFDNLDNLIKKSTLISSVGEKERIQFFNKLRSKVTANLDKI